MKSSLAPRRHLDPASRSPSPRLRVHCCCRRCCSYVLQRTRSRGAWGGPRRTRRHDRLNADSKPFLLGIADGEEWGGNASTSTQRSVLCASAHLCAAAWNPVAQRSRRHYVQVPRLATLARNERVGVALAWNDMALARNEMALARNDSSLTEPARDVAHGELPPRSSLRAQRPFRADPVERVEQPVVSREQRRVAGTR
jgi:hypothetical protein